jgi:hypothetical protein
VCDDASFTIIERAEFVCGHAVIVSVRCYGPEPCPQLQSPFFNAFADCLSYPRKELTDGNPENFLARECGLKRRQPAPFFIPGHLSAARATEQKTNLVLSEAGSLAICAEIVFESWGRHLWIEIANQCDCLP